MPFPTSLWTGKVTATVAINGQGVVSCTFEGDLVLEISLGPPLQGENLPGTDAYPAMTNRIEGGLQGTFNGTATPGAERSQGSGIVAYYIVGIYDPVTHTISINTTTTGIKATGTYVSPSNSSAIAISEGMTGSSGPVFLPGVATDSSIVSLGETSTDPDNLLSNCLPNAPNASQPIVLDLQKSGVQTIVQTDQNWMGSVATTWNFTLDAHQIEVEIDPSELDPTANNPSATLTVTVTSNRQPGKSETVSLQLCTYIGGMLNDATHAPDGHLHDQRTDMCDHSSRPAG